LLVFLELYFYFHVKTFILADSTQFVGFANATSRETLPVTFTTQVLKEKMITSEELINLIENDVTESSAKHIAENILEAINDWPTENLSEPSELISELKRQINGKLTRENIEEFVRTLNVEKDSWKIESLSYILEIFDLERSENVDGKMELEMIMERIANR
jgi:hypothetical protein